MDLSKFLDSLLNKVNTESVTALEFNKLQEEMKKVSSGSYVVSKLLANRIQEASSNTASSNEKAIISLEFLSLFLDHISTTSENKSIGIEFKSEIGRYRFLNEIIRILSPKYVGNTTDARVKERAVRFIKDCKWISRKGWFSENDKNKEKIDAVYKTLVESNVINNNSGEEDDDDEYILNNQQNNSSGVSNNPKFDQSSIFNHPENELKLKRLLKSKNPEDIKAANQLIKNLAESESKRNERKLTLKQTTEKIETVAMLLSEMLTQDTLDREIVNDLVSNLKDLRIDLSKFETETDEEVKIILKVGENIENVLKHFENRITNNNNDDNSAKPKEIATSTSSNNVDTTNTTEKKGSGVIEGNLIGLLSSPSEEDDDDGIINLEQSHNPPSHLDLMELIPESSLSSQDNSKEAANNPLSDLDEISRKLLEQSLENCSPNTISGVGGGCGGGGDLGIESSSNNKFFCNKKGKSNSVPHHQQVLTINQMIQNKAEANKVSMNKLNSLPIDSSQNHASMALDLDFFLSPRKSESELSQLSPLLISNKESKAKAKEEENGNLNEFKTEKDSSVSNINSILNKTKEDKPVVTNKINKSNQNTNSKISLLNLIKSVDLNEIQISPSSNSQINPFEIQIENDGEIKKISLTFTFGSYKFQDANNFQVIIVSLTNKESLNLFNYVFQLIPPKGITVKLLQPSNTEIPAWSKTFLPPNFLTQVALIVKNSNEDSQKEGSDKTQIKMRFILSFCLFEETILHDGHFFINF